MLIGIPKEIKAEERRVGLVPQSVRELIQQGHRVLIERGAGLGIGKTDADYERVGAEIVATAKQIFEQAEMVVKVKEPQKVEYEQLREGQILFTYLHLAPDAAQTKGLQKSGVTAIAYETVTSNSGALPLLAPMSEVAGRMSVQVGAHCLESPYGGSGILLGGVPGVMPGKVVVLGGGVAGANAVAMAVGQGADVTVVDRNMQKLQELDTLYAGRIKTAYSTATNVEKLVLEADLVIGTVLIPGASAPKLVTRKMVERMKKGSVIIDVAVDQGGCVETTHATTHKDPTFVVDGVVHYCVANMPGGVAQTSTYALNNVTLPYVLEIANKGVKLALQEDPHLLNGLNVMKGKITYEAVAVAMNETYTPPHEVL